MAGSWYSIIEKDLESAEAVMHNVVRSRNADLNEMCEYVIGSPGKRIRPSVCLLSYYAAGGRDNPAKAIDVGAALELIHTASLIHDDINDEGEIRRGKKTLHKEYSISRSIITGDFIFAMGFRLLRDVSGTIVDFVVEASSAMSAGEFVQQDFEHNVSVDVDNYLNIIDGKTAKFIECAAKSGAYLAGANLDVIDAIGNYAEIMGKAFQIIDDTLDIIGDSKSTGKGIGNDILEGKPTLPVIFAMDDPEHGEEIKAIFEKEVCSSEDVERFLELMSKTNSVDRCRQMARDLMNEADKNLEILPESEYKTALKDLAEYVLCRSK